MTTKSKLCLVCGDPVPEKLVQFGRHAFSNVPADVSRCFIHWIDLNLEARKKFLAEIITIQMLVNQSAFLLNRPYIDILNDQEIDRIIELINLNTWPKGWDGTEIVGDIMLDKKFCDGSTMNILFEELRTV